MAPTIFLKWTCVLPHDHMHMTLSSDFEKIVPFIVKLEVKHCTLSDHRAFFRINLFSGKLMWHLININGMVYLADAMGLYTWWKHVKVCLRRLFIKTTRRNTPNYWTPKYEIQNVLVQERSAGGRYDIGILSLCKTNLSLLYLFFIVYILTTTSSHT